MYESQAQRGFFHAHKEELEKQGVDVAEWDKASEGKKLPERVGEKPSREKAAAAARRRRAGSSNFR